MKSFLKLNIIKINYTRVMTGKIKKKLQTQPNKECYHIM